jgi:hypothetical protein
VTWEPGPPPPPGGSPPPGWYPQGGYAPPGYPPPGSYPPPGGYPPPGYYGGYGYPPRTDTRAVWALVLSIGSFVVCPVVPAIAALILASGARRDIAASGGGLQGAGMVTAATVISWINIGLAILAVALGIIVIAAARTTSSVSGLLLAWA